MSNELRLDDGFSTIITLALAPTIKLYEKEVTPPGMEANGPIDTTTMRNTAWRTNAPKQLKSQTPVTATVAYATSAIPLLHAQIGVVQLVTVTFPDGSTLAFYGWLDNFTPGSNTEGEQPTASITVQPSMVDPVTGLEAPPVYTAPVDSAVS